MAEQEDTPQRPWCLTYWIMDKQHQDSLGMEMHKDGLVDRVNRLRKFFAINGFLPMESYNPNFTKYHIGDYGIVHLLKEKNNLDNITFMIRLIAETKEGIKNLVESCELPYNPGAVDKISISEI